MKMNKTISMMFGVLTIILAACEPIENRDVLSNSFDPDEIQLEVIQSTPGGNEFSLRMNTPGVIGYWDFLIDRKYTDRVDNIIFPIMGTSTITYFVATPYLENNDIDKISYISKTIDVTVTQIDHPLPEAYYKLVGANLEGKTWVFDGVGGDEGLWYYMTDPANWMGMWWNAGGTCCPPDDASGKMVFDLNGGANYTYYASPAASPVTGSKWSFNKDFTKLILTGSANLLGFRDGDGKVFEIKEFTSDRLTLFVSASSQGTGWVWKFKPAP
jgi:hypothetical protein